MVHQPQSNKRTDPFVITERQILMAFPSIWAEVFPFLSPHFMTLFNEAYSMPIRTASGRRIPPLPVPDGLKHLDLVSEFGFHLARLAIPNGISVEAAYESPQIKADAAAAACELAILYEQPVGNAPLELNHEQFVVGYMFAQNYERLFQGANTTSIEFWPMVPGSGLLPACRCDVSVENTLYEVKTVNRRYHSKDIRQVFIYLALQSATGARRWTQAALFNPRLSTIAQFDVDVLVGQLSGGRPALEVFDELISRFIRDQELDRSF